MKCFPIKFPFIPENRGKNASSGNLAMYQACSVVSSNAALLHIKQY
jgi:hypothetical protein